MSPAPAASARSPAAPRTYAWTEDGRVTAGTLADYARSYARPPVPGTGLSAEVRTWHAAYPVQAEVLAAVPGADCSWPVRLSVPGEQVTVRVRAAARPPARPAQASTAAFGFPAEIQRFPAGEDAPRGGTYIRAAPGISVLVCRRGAGTYIRIDTAAADPGAPPLLPLEAEVNNGGEPTSR